MDINYYLVAFFISISDNLWLAFGIKYFIRVA